jgi:hypothetical protein
MNRRPNKAKSKFTPEQRSEMVTEITLRADQEQVRKARNVAAILAEGGDDDDEDAVLAVTYYYSLKQNSQELDDIIKKMTL